MPAVRGLGHERVTPGCTAMSEASHQEANGHLKTVSLGTFLGVSHVKFILVTK